jgi:hypothetical protein
MCLPPHLAERVQVRSFESPNRSRELRQGCVMRSPQKYWQYARECARWARETKQDDDRELFERMSKAWVHIAQLLFGEAILPPRLRPCPSGSHNGPAGKRGR